MPVSITLQIRSKGSLTIPASMRKKYSLKEGDVVTLIDLGEGAFLLAPLATQVDRFGDRVAQILESEGVTVDEILETLDQERERYYQERYAGD